MGFREWYEQRNGTYPGLPDELIQDIMVRLTSAIAAYVDEMLAKKLGDK